MPLFSIALVISLALCGPSFEFNDLRRQFGPNLSAPLIFQFLIAFAAMALFSINPTLLIDCFPERPASATALNNLCRCLLGTAGVSVIQPLIDEEQIKLIEPLTQNTASRTSGLVRVRLNNLRAEEMPVFTNQKLSRLVVQTRNKDTATEQIILPIAYTMDASRFIPLV
ncbi:uncharacterized protein NFIA_049770 [Aspergillus fischeri NRRL 181]|uniref:Uncharacterized protein n=1 Tax=Neosartorya fischeri (strain ATCC 1020 / DSM 3700 / CBS 544.65 / FGSC A1164 / JCM 1740 / NRRL 181 / WB 181) TaxID=331117 RepID=A1DLG5_NEOFI|nr:uncharacterized protein NFIA_049770 [Aspergillus fischeri NRRL 181]EAW15636.1 hypothetical protein NFIA_049770 [Aspergillus fischeri NRRL 181]